ncbi:hypothetical protein MRB53_017810 [Persea americana]|uniref:Uncharacterized protein n=1 Tax=Persea americana TaxID=3435 RepID=A0ACC2M682_PERAE|nr:hypothetical protein MRB53_017810 [Persea americana]
MAFHFPSQTPTDRPPNSIPLHKDDLINARQQHTRKLSPSISEVEERGQRNKVVGGMMERHDNQRLAGSEFDGDDEGLIYNVDYHGVTTHPSPYPKHPKP